MLVSSAKNIRIWSLQEVVHQMRSNFSIKVIITNHSVPSTTSREKSILLISHMMIVCLLFLEQMVMLDCSDLVKSHDLYLVMDIISRSLFKIIFYLIDRAILFFICCGLGTYWQILRPNWKEYPSANSNIEHFEQEFEVFLRLAS